MAYATQADIITLYGDDALYAAERDGVLDALAVSRALTSASDEIDTYLHVRYDLPLANPPGILRTFAVDIGLYRLASTAAVMTEELRQRYDDAIKHLMRIADGKASLVFPVDPDADPDADPTPGPSPIVADGPERLFTREKLRGL